VLRTLFPCCEQLFLCCERLFPCCEHFFHVAPPPSSPDIVYILRVMLRACGEHVASLWRACCDHHPNIRCKVGGWLGGRPIFSPVGRLIRSITVSTYSHSRTTYSTTYHKFHIHKNYTYNILTNLFIYKNYKEHKFTRRIMQFTQMRDSHEILKKERFQIWWHAVTCQRPTPRPAASSRRGGLRPSQPPAASSRHPS
jgi:hypothetical protein